MIAHPVLLPTASGAQGAVVTVPDGPPVAAAVVLQAFGSTRAGTNQTYVRLAEGLADLGVVTLRFDYPTFGESHALDLSSGLDASTELLAWFRARTEGLDLLVYAYCFGVAPAAMLSRTEERLAGVAIVTPPMIRTNADGWERRREPLPSRAWRRVRRLRRLPYRLVIRLAYGTPDSPTYTEADEDSGEWNPDGMLRELVDAAPVWVLVGELDLSTPVLRELEPELSPSGRFELEVVDGLVMYRYRTQEAQDAFVERSLAWAARCLAPAAAVS